MIRTGNYMRVNSFGPCLAFYAYYMEAIRESYHESPQFKAADKQDSNVVLMHHLAQQYDKCATKSLHSSLRCD